MKYNIEEKYKIDAVVVKNYVNAINSMIGPISKIITEIKELTEPYNQSNSEDDEMMKPIKQTTKQMLEEIKKLSIAYPNERKKILTNTIIM